MNIETLQRANSLKAHIAFLTNEIEDLKEEEENKKDALEGIDRYGCNQYLPDQVIEQIYYLVLSALEDEKEKLEKEFESL
jgi:hypothetical protein